MKNKQLASAAGITKRKFKIKKQTKNFILATWRKVYSEMKLWAKSEAFPNLSYQNLKKTKTSQKLTNDWEKKENFSTHTNNSLFLLFTFLDPAD